MAVVVSAVACGRVGFEAGAGGDDASDVDATIDAACVATGTCDPIAITGCCDGTACYSDIGGSSFVCLAPGLVAENEHCSTTNDCVPGTTCADNGGWITCRRVCAVTSDCTNGAGSRCSYSAGAGRVCSQGCDPFLDTGCPADGGCRVMVDTFGDFVTECTFAGTRTQGQFCTGDAQCDGGYACTGSICRKICRVGGSDCTNPYPTCGPNSTPAIIGGTEYGTCDP
jgi:hypothetical protein